jgi:transcription initiation factor TFIID subunit 2
MTVRIHEADGTPYEHVLDIRSPFKRFEVPFNTKYKRIRRNTKRYLARQAAAQAAAEGDAEAAEAMGLIDMGFGLEIWEKEKERENWKVADWTEEDEQVMSGATYEWIRMDADFEWIAAIAFEQPDFMWVSQLQRDRDVVAQLEVSHSSTIHFPGLNFHRLSTLSQSNRPLLFRAHSPRQCSSLTTIIAYGVRLRWL